MRRIGLCLFAVVLMSGVAACSDDDGTASSGGGSSTLIVDSRVTVGGGGGAAYLSFQGQSGKLVRITLTSAASMAPYGFIEPPGGNATYTPPHQNASNGSNTAEVVLTGTSGQVSYTVFDGNNVGGAVQVQIWMDL